MAQEVKVFFKIREEKFAEVQDYILKHCSYEVPEVSKILLDAGNPAYFEWIDSMVK